MVYIPPRMNNEMTMTEEDFKSNYGYLDKALNMVQEQTASLTEQDQNLSQKLIADIRFVGASILTEIKDRAGSKRAGRDAVITLIQTLDTESGAFRKEMSLTQKWLEMYQVANTAPTDRLDSVERQPLTQEALREKVMKSQAVAKALQQPFREILNSNNFVQPVLQGTVNDSDPYALTSVQRYKGGEFKRVGRLTSSQLPADVIKDLKIGNYITCDDITFEKNKEGLYQNTGAVVTNVKDSQVPRDELCNKLDRKYLFVPLNEQARK